MGIYNPGNGYKLVCSVNWLNETKNFFWLFSFEKGVICKKKIQYIKCLYVSKKTIKFLILFKSVFCFCSGSVVYDRLYSALTNNALMKGIMNASPLAQTSCLEGFQSVLNQFAPKMIAYSYIGLYCR